MIHTVAMLSRRRRYCQQCGTGSGSCFQQPGRWFALYIREVVSNRVYHLISDYGGHEFSTSDRHACGIKSANFQKRGVLYKQQRISPSRCLPCDAAQVSRCDEHRADVRCPANQHQNGVQAAARGQNPGDENRALVSHPQSPPVYLPSDLRSTLSSRESTVLIVLRRCVMLFLSTADRGRPKPKEGFFYGRRASAIKKRYLLCGTDLQNL